MNVTYSKINSKKRMGGGEWIRKEDNITSASAKDGIQRPRQSAPTVDVRSEVGLRNGASLEVWVELRNNVKQTAGGDSATQGLEFSGCRPF